MIHTLRRPAAVAAAALLASAAMVGFTASPSLAATEGDWVFATSPAGATITSYLGSDHTLAIPSTLGGEPVVAIGDSAFAGSNISGDIAIPGSIQIIGSKAFAGLNISSVTIADGVQSINGSAFAGTAMSGELRIPNSVTTIGSQAFANNHLSTVTLGSGLSTIGAGAFSHNNISALNWASTSRATAVLHDAFQSNALTSVVLPSGVAGIESGAFGDNRLQSFTAPSTLTSVGASGWDQVWPDSSKDMIGWYDSPVPGANAKRPDSLVHAGGTIYSQWSLTRVTIDTNGGVFPAQPSKTTAAFDVDPRQPMVAPPVSVTREGYTFTGWSTAPDGKSGLVKFPATVTDIASVNLYAQWSVNMFAVTFDTAGGSPVVAPQSVAYGSAIAPMPQVTKPLHRLVKWMNGVDEWNLAESTVTSDAALVAVWQERSVVAPQVMKPGAPLKVTGGGFQPGETVLVSIDGSHDAIGVATAAADGTVTFALIAPSDLKPGDHKLTIAGSITGSSSTITNVDGAQGDASVASGALAHVESNSSGGNVSALVTVLALLAAVTAAAAVILIRRRRA